MAGVGFGLRAIIGTCIISGALGYWVGSARQPEAKEPVVIERKVDYSRPGAALSAWRQFPDDIRYSILEHELQSMPAGKLYGIGKSLIMPRLVRKVSPGNEDHKDMQQVYDLLSDYLGEKK